MATVFVACGVAERMAGPANTCEVFGGSSAVD